MTETPRFLARREGQLWLAGVLLMLLLAIEFLLMTILWPEPVRGLLLGLGAEIVTGREGGIPVGLAAGAPRLMVWQVSFTQDLAGAFFAFPFFLLLLERYHERNNWFMRRVRLVEAAADRHQAFVHRWGPVGLALFMLMPFLVNGPLIALIVGRLAGMKLRDVLWPVVVATIAVAGAWTFFFDRMIVLANAFDPRLGWVIAGGAVVIVVALGVTDFVREHLGHRRKQRADEEE